MGYGIEDYEDWEDEDRDEYREDRHGKSSLVGQTCDVCFEGDYEIVPGTLDVECNECGHRIPRYGW